MYLVFLVTLVELYGGFCLVDIEILKVVGIDFENLLVNFLSSKVYTSSRVPQCTNW